MSHSGNGSGDGTLIRVTIIVYNTAVIEDLLTGGIGTGSGTIECPSEGQFGENWESKSPGEQCQFTAGYI